MRKLLLLAGSCVALLVPFAVSAAKTPTASPAMDYAIEQKIFSPDSNGDVDAQGYVTRLDFTLATVDMLYSEENFDRCFDDIAPSRNSQFTLLFSDVERDSWFAKHVCVAMRAGLIKSDARGNFRPYAVITTAEASKILAKAYGLLYPPSYVTTQSWYEGPMLALSLRSAIPTDIAPAHPVNRAEMATMFYALRNQQRYPETRIIGSNGQTTLARIGCRTQTPVTSNEMTVNETLAAVTTDTVTWYGPCNSAYRARSPGQSLILQGLNAHPTYVEKPSSRLIRQQWDVPVVRPGLTIDPAVYY